MNRDDDFGNFGDFNQDKVSASVMKDENKSEENDDFGVFDEA